MKVMGKVISIKKFLRSKKSQNSNKGNNETVANEKIDMPSSESERGWYFASLSESDTATILRFLGYLFGFVFLMVAVPAGFSDWVQRGLFLSATVLLVSYLIVLRRRSK